MTEEQKHDGHRLAAGQVVQSKWRKLGGHRGPQVLDPSLIMALIMGFPDAGKSHLLESNPEAFIFNCDGTSTSNPDTVATIYPGYNAKGEMVDENGKVRPLTYEDIREKVATLEKMAANNEDRPTTVVFDSMTTLVALLKKWVPNNLFAATKGKEFRHLDGQMAWDALYTEVLSIFCRVRDAGYGCYVIAHLKRDIKNRGKDSEKETIIPAMSTNFAQKLLAHFEMVLSIDCELRYTSGGYKRVVTLGATYPDLTAENMYKHRVPIKVTLPAENGWQAFVDAYYAGLKQVHSKEQSNSPA